MADLKLGGITFESTAKAKPLEMRDPGSLECRLQECPVDEVYPVDEVCQVDEDAKDIISASYNFVNAGTECPTQGEFYRAVGGGSETTSLAQVIAGKVAAVKLSRK